MGIASVAQGQSNVRPTRHEPQAVPATGPGGAAPLPADDLVRGHEEILALLKRERARADRSGCEFSFVMLGINGGADAATPSGQTARLAAQVRRRARETDEVGYCFGSFVCALLPGTSSAGGWRFAQDVAGSMGIEPSAIVCGVYTYPSAWIPADAGAPASRYLHLGDADGHARQTNGDGRYGAIANQHDNGNGQNGSGQSGNGHNGNVRHGVAAAATSLPPGGVGLTPALSPVNGPLQLLFARPAPWSKRAVDVVGAALGLVGLAPVLVLVAAGVKLTSRGPIIYRQVRAGQGGRPFVLYKFRSMRVGADAEQGQLRSQSEQDGPAFKLRADPRVTRFGRFIRKASLDELPQLWNVLKGDMSLVGPRPLPWAEACACEPWQRRRLDVLPGITCVWQVEGRSRVSFVRWMRMDIAYIRSRSLLRDVRLVARTIPAVLFRRGAS